MLYRTEIVDYKYYAKALFTYVITVSASFAAKTSVFPFSTSHDEQTYYSQRSLKRRVLQTNQTQILPLVEAVEVGRFTLTSNIQSIDVQNNILYVAGGEHGMQILNISDPARIFLLGTYQTMGFAHQIQKVGNYAYIAYDIAGLRIVDISNLQNPMLAGVYMMGDSPKRLPVTNLAIGNTGATIFNQLKNIVTFINITNPSYVFRVFIDIPTANVLDNFIDIKNNTVYVAGNGLTIIDVKDPTNPQFISSLTFTDKATDICVDGVIAYIAYIIDYDIASYESGLHIVDVSQFNSPRLITNYTTHTMIVSGVKVSQPYAYIVGNNLSILDVSNSSNPLLVRSFPAYVDNNFAPFLCAPQFARNMAITIFQHTIYMTTSDPCFYLQIIDVLNPLNPQQIAGQILNGTQFIPFLTADNGIVYVGDEYGLQIISVLNPSQIGQLSYLPTSSFVIDVCVSNNTAYLALERGGFQVIDVTYPANPSLITLLHLSYRDRPRSVKIEDNFAYVAINMGLQILEIHQLFQFNFDLDPSIYFNDVIRDLFSSNDLILYTQKLGLFIVDSSRFDISWTIEASTNNFPICVMNNLAFVPGNVGINIQIFNVSSPSNVFNISSIFFTSLTDTKIAISNNILYVYGYISNQLSLYNVSVPITPHLVSIFNLTDMYTILPSDPFIYLTAGSGIYIVDASNPYNPTIIGNVNYTCFSSVTEMVINEEILFVVDGCQSALVMIDVSDQTNPARISIHDTNQIGLNSFISSIHNIGKILYVYESYYKGGFGLVKGGFTIFDTADPYNLQELSYFSGGIGAFSVVNDTVYLLDIDLLDLVDVSDLTNPYLKKQYSALQYAASVTIAGQYAYITTSAGNSFQIIDVSTPPHYSINKIASQATVFNNVVYLADNEKTLYVINITDILNPIEISRYQLQNIVLDMIVDNTYLYIAEGLFGIEILDITNSSQPVFAARITRGLTNAKSIKVEGSRLYVIDNYQQVVVFDINPIFYLSAQMSIQEGERHIVTISEIAVTNFPSALYMSVSNITHGQFEVVSQPGIIIINFTSAQVQASQIIFVQDGGKIAPSFNLLASDGITTQGPFTANILFQPINYPPVLGFHFIQINEGESIILNISNFNATDDLTPDLQLQFITTLQSNSQFEQISQPGVIITRFSQQDLMNGTILFRHLDQSSAGDLTPFCMVSVFDGQLYSTPVRIQFAYHVAPKFVTNQLTIYRGQLLTISMNELQASDPHDVASTLIFIINNVTHGSFTKTTFTQEEITQGAIQYQHDGSDQSPSYSVSIQDSFMTTTSQAAIVTFTDKNPNLLLDAAGIGGTVAGGAVGLGLLIGGIFAYRNYARNEQSRKHEPYAAAVYQALKPIDAANFNSPSGQQFVQALKTLKDELSQQGIDVALMGTWELNQLADQITFAINNEIRPRKNWRGERVVRGQDIKNYSSTIALVIQRIRAGVYVPPTVFAKEETRLIHALHESNELEMGNMESYKQPLLAGF